MGRDAVLTETVKLQSYELELIKTLIEGSAYSNLIIDNIDSAEITSLDFTGSGYFLTLFHSKFPKKRDIFHKPYVATTIDNKEYGFLVSIGSNELMIECHTYQDELPKNFRTRPIILNVN